MKDKGENFRIKKITISLSFKLCSTCFKEQSESALHAVHVKSFNLLTQDEVTQNEEKHLYRGRRTWSRNLCRVSSLRIIAALHRMQYQKEQKKKKKRMDAAKNEDLKDDEEQA